MWIRTCTIFCNKTANDDLLFVMEFLWPSAHNNPHLADHASYLCCRAASLCLTISLGEPVKSAAQLYLASCLVYTVALCMWLLQHRDSCISQKQTNTTITPHTTLTYLSVVYYTAASKTQLVKDTCSFHYVQALLSNALLHSHSWAASHCEPPVRSVNMNASHTNVDSHTIIIIYKMYIASYIICKEIALKHFTDIIIRKTLPHEHSTHIHTYRHVYVYIYIYI